MECHALAMPASRHALQGILAEAKVGRSMLLTTHSMEEADVLCNRIGIVSLGRRVSRSNFVCREGP